MPQSREQQEQLRRTREDILRAIEDLTEAKGYPPLRSEIATHVGVSSDHVYRTVRKLIKEGRLTEGDGPRTLQIKL